ncbi:PapD-like protein [Blakeslea trispora]|nr:PapD-like protein [Blakeslea trispora]
MSVVITPSEQLEFHRPFTRVSKESLHVKNPGPEPIVFKVKTTAPKQYCVRPNAGRIEANSEIEVQIILQPFREEPPEDYKCKDKFLVQTAPFPVGSDEAQNDITTLWSYIEANEKGSMHQHKIKCVFLGQELRESDELQENEQEQLAPQQPQQQLQQQEQAIEEISPIPEQAKNTEQVASSDTVLSPSSTEPINTVQNDELLTQAAPTAATAASVAAPIAANTNTTITPTTTLSDTTRTPREVTQNNPAEATQLEPTKEQLREALEKIELLEKQLADVRKEEGLRARNLTGSSARKLASTVQPLDAVHQHLAALETPKSVEGYPPQVVMGIALLVFIFTYLFF